MKTKVLITALILTGMLFGTGIFAQSSSSSSGLNLTIRFAIDYSEKMKGEHDEGSMAAKCLGTFVTQMLALKADGANRFGDINYHFDAIYESEDKKEWVFAHDKIVTADKAGKISKFNTQDGKPWTDDGAFDKAPWKHFLAPDNFEDDATKETDWNSYIINNMLHDDATQKRRNTIYIFCVSKMPSESTLAELNKKLQPLNSWCWFVDVSSDQSNPIIDKFNRLQEILPRDPSRLSIDCSQKDVEKGLYTCTLKGARNPENILGVEWEINGIKMGNGTSLNVTMTESGEYDIVASVRYKNSEVRRISTTHKVGPTQYDIALDIQGKKYHGGNEININPGTANTVKAKIEVKTIPANAQKTLKGRIAINGAIRELDPLPENFDLSQGKKYILTIKDAKNEKIKEFKITVQPRKEPREEPPGPTDPPFKVIEVLDGEGNVYGVQNGVYTITLPEGEEDTTVKVYVSEESRRFNGTVGTQTSIPGEDGIWQTKLGVGTHDITFACGNQKAKITVVVKEAKPGTGGPTDDPFDIQNIKMNGTVLGLENGVCNATLPADSETAKIEFTVRGTVDGIFSATLGDETEEVAGTVWAHDFAAGTYKITLKSGKASKEITLVVTAASSPNPPEPPFSITRLTADGNEVVPVDTTYTITLDPDKKETEVEVETSSDSFTVTINSETEDSTDGVWSKTFEPGTYSITIEDADGNSAFYQLTVEQKQEKQSSGKPSTSSDSEEGGSGILWILLAIVGAGVVGGIILIKRLSNGAFKLSLNDVPYNKFLAPGEYKIDSSMFTDCDEPFTVILSTKKEDDALGYFVQFKLMPGWTLFEGSRAIPLNKDCSDELQINSEVYKIRTPKKIMEFKITLKDS